MNIKSLLLGSAAALLAVSGARAADMVEVAPEAEPMEYVRICDTYGAGFYYIPGTETCLKVGGFVRYQVDFGNEWREATRVRTSDGARWDWDRAQASDYGWQKSLTASVVLDARSETELGTLRGYMDLRLKTGNASVQNRDEFVGNYTTDGRVGGVHSWDFDAAYIQLGGLTIGYLANPFDSGFSGIEQDVLGGATTHSIAYTFEAGNGFSATVSLDDDGDVISGWGAYENDNPASKAHGDRSGADFIPNVSGAVKYTSSAFTAGLFGAYDNDTNEFAIKGEASVNVTEADKILLGAYWASGPTYVLGDGYAFDLPSSGPLYRSSIKLAGVWSVQGAYQHTFSDRLNVAIAGVYINDVGFSKDSWRDNPANVGPYPGWKLNFWRVGTTVNYTIVPGFDTKLSVNYNKFTGSAVKEIDSWHVGDKLGDGYVDGFLRFQRSF